MLISVRTRKVEVVLVVLAVEIHMSIMDEV